MGFSLPAPLADSARSTRAVALGLALVLLACAAMLQLAPGLDARLLDSGFALNRQAWPQPVANDVVVVGIDEAFLDLVEEPLTLSHRYLAAFLRGVSQAGARVIALDLVLPEKRFDTLVSTSDPEFDFHRTLLAGLLETLPRSRLVLAKVWDIQRSHYRDIQIDYAAVLSTQAGGVQALASALFCSDDDTRIRRYPGADGDCQPDRTPYTLSSEVSAAMGVRRPWSGLINYQIGPAFHYIPLQQILALAASDPQALRRLVAGKAVMLGTVQDDTDLVNVPVPLADWRPGNRRVPGVLVHAQAVRGMLNQGMIATMAAPLHAALSLSGGLFWLHGAVRRKLLLVAGLSLALLAGSDLMLRQGYWMAPTALLLNAWLAALARSAWQGWLAYGERRRLSRTFSGYVSPHVMRQILSGDVDVGRSGSKREVCVLFSDIRNFTALSERMAAEQVVQLLNRYFGRLTAMVHKHGGTVDKFIGDGMMAFFGAPNDLPSPEAAALSAARDMLAALDELNRELLSEGKEALAIGIGLHSGPAIIGYVGSSDRHEYTAIGDTVNVASRLEGLCRQLGYPLLCSEEVVARLASPAGMDALGPHPLKGHSAVAVHGWRPHGPPQSVAD